MYPAAPQPFPPQYAPPSQPLPPGYSYGQPAQYSQPLPPYPYGQPGAPIPPSVPFYSPQPGMPAPYSQPWAPPAAPARVGPDPLDRLFGASPTPASVSPRNAVQRRFRESLPQYATNPIAGAIVGAGVAAALCILVNLLIILVVGAFTSGQAAAALSQYNGVGLFLLIAIEHHADLVAGAFGASASVTVPITTLLIIPAVCLVLGGFISASTDYSNQLRFVLTRAAAVGPVYAILMTFLTAVFGTASVVGVSFGPSWSSMLLYSLVFGSLFALVGGLIKIFGRRWRAGTLAFLLSRPRGPITAGIVGAVAAVATGLLLSTALYAFAVGLADVTTRLPSAFDTALSPTPEVLLLLGYAIGALPGAVTAFAFSAGASASTQSLSLGLLSSSGSSSTGSSDISLFHLPPDTQYLLLVLLIPVIAYFIGGRVAARVLGAAQQQQALAAGAIVGVVSSVLMLVLAALSSAASSAGASIFGSSSATAGINIGGAFLGALVFGVVFGCIGATLYKQSGSTLSRSGEGVGWRNIGVVLCIVFGGAVLGLTLAGSSLLANMSFDTFARWVPIIGGALLGLPALCFAIAAVRGLFALQPGDAALAQAVAPSAGAGAPQLASQPAGVAATYRPMTPPLDSPPTA